jgi:P27 family predicted phage terminase small subunit
MQNDPTEEQPPETPPPPEYLDAEAKTEWVRVIADLIAIGTIDRVDQTALTAYCTTYGRWKEAEKQVREGGMIVKVNGVPVANPYLSIANKSMEQMRRFLREFGLSPSSRV